MQQINVKDLYADLTKAVACLTDDENGLIDGQAVGEYAKKIYQTLTNRRIVKTKPLGNVPSKPAKKKILGMHVDRDDLSAAELDEIDEQYAPRYGWVVAREVFDGDELEYFEGMIRRGHGEDPSWTPLLKEAEVFYDRVKLEVKLKKEIGRSPTTRLIKVMEEYVGMGHYGHPVFVSKKKGKRK